MDKHNHKLIIPGYGGIVVAFSLILSLAFSNTFNNDLINKIHSKPEIVRRATVYTESNREIPLKKSMDTNSDNIALLRRGEEITLLESKVNWFHVETSDGKTGYIDNRNVKTNHLPPVKFHKSMKDRIMISQERQKLYIIKDNEVIREFVVSTGLENTQTPNGLFIVEHGMRGTWFFSNKYQQGGRYWIGFRGNYLFHSVPMDRNQNIIPEEYKRIGKPASHGCIRLYLDDAKWLYDNIIDGTPVLIRP
ncbi:MAG TPA: L,D-transpeptidase family protein [Thermoanaerobacterales bacterium]|nr:L,D-transpeptidase family protein [Thermoanaerobacterales bacterium]